MGSLPKLKQSTKKRAVIYTRKSTTAGLEQDFNSLDAQKESCEQYILNRQYDGWEQSETYEDGGYTGANINRPGFQQLMHDVEDGKVDIVVTYKVDRLSRSLLDFAQMMSKFNEYGVAFVAVTQNFSTADAMGRLTLNMLMSFAEFEREMIAERTRDKIAGARRRGKWTGGNVPLGYDIKDKKLVVNEFEALLVNDIFDLYQKHQSTLKVACILNDKNCRTKRYEANSGVVIGNKKWNKDKVLKVIKNPVYAGYTTLNGELFDGEHQAIIEKGVWSACQAILKKNRCNSKRAKGPANSDYILSGLLKCACCKNAYVGATSMKSKQKRYRYYRCVTRDKNGKNACKGKPIPAEMLENFVVDKIKGIAGSDSITETVIEKMNQQIDEKSKKLKAERDTLPKQIAKISAEAQRLVERSAELPGKTGKFLNKRIDEAGSALEELENRLQQVELQIVELSRQKLDAEWIAETLHHFENVWQHMTLTNRHRLLRAMVNKVIIDEPNETVEVIIVDFGGVK